MSLKAKTTSKIGFCLHPENCVFFYDIFSILVVEKSDKFSNFHKEKLDANKLNAIYKKIDPKAYQTFDKLFSKKYCILSCCLIQCLLLWVKITQP